MTDASEPTRASFSPRRNLPVLYQLGRLCLTRRDRAQSVRGNDAEASENCNRPTSSGEPRVEGRRAVYSCQSSYSMRAERESACDRVRRPSRACSRGQRDKRSTRAANQRARGRAGARAGCGGWGRVSPVLFESPARCKSTQCASPVWSAHTRRSAETSTIRCRASTQVGTVVTITLQRLHQPGLDQRPHPTPNR